MLLWLTGLDLRVTLLALPPLLPVVSRDLGLDRTAVGALTNLPVLLLGVAAVVGSAVIARVGARSALVAGLAVEAVAGALRGVGPSLGVLFATTFVMGLGVAVIQPALPTLVRQWLPDAVGPATALYGNGLLVGEALAASITLPAVLPATGSWPASLAAWSAPVALAIGVAAVAARKEPSLPDSAGAPAGPSPARRASRGWPDWSDGRTWKLGLVQGGASSIYFATNTFLPGYLHTIGSPGLVGATLAAMNVSQLPASVLLLAFSRRLVGRRWPFLWLGGILLAATAGLLFAPAPLLLAPVAVIGFATALSLLMALALPAVWAAPEDVPRLSAGMFTVGYSMAFLLPVLGGAASDASHSAGVALVPALAGAVIVVAAASRFPGHAAGEVGGGTGGGTARERPAGAPDPAG